MTDQTIPADKVREIIAAHRDGPRRRAGVIISALEALLPAPPRPTLAEMTLDEQDECVGMQADLVQGDRVVILDGTPDYEGFVQVLERSLDVYRPSPADVTPRPDLPRLEWPGEDQGGEEVTKVDYVSVAGGRTAYGPWTVARLRKKADPAPALPDGWRLADHKDYGRVIVTNPTPNRNGRVYFVLPAADPLGYDLLFGPADELTFLDQEADTPTPPNTLAVGSAWGKTDALARACKESGRDQIVVLDLAGDAYVWSEAAEWWESVPPMSVNAPFTIIHEGKKAHQ